MKYLVAFNFKSEKNHGCGDISITTKKAIREANIDEIKNSIKRDLLDDNNASVVILNIMKFPIK